MFIEIRKIKRLQKAGTRTCHAKQWPTPPSPVESRQVDLLDSFLILTSDLHGCNYHGTVKLAVHVVVKSLFCGTVTCLQVNCTTSIHNIGSSNTKVLTS